VRRIFSGKTALLPLKPMLPLLREKGEKERERGSRASSPSIKKELRYGGAVNRIPNNGRPSAAVGTSEEKEKAVERGRRERASPNLMCHALPTGAAAGGSTSCGCSVPTQRAKCTFH
jgi:hypothetical protein